jgi:hypothetical protein
MPRAHNASFKNIHSILRTFTAWITVYIFEMDRQHLVVPAKCLPSSPLWQQPASNVTWSLPYINLNALYKYWIRLRRRFLNDTCSETIFNLLLILVIRFILPAILPSEWNAVPQFMEVILFHAWTDDRLISWTSQSHRTCKAISASPPHLYKWHHLQPQFDRCHFNWQCSTNCHVTCLSWLPSTTHSLNRVTMPY